jgi:hypothetical protein
VSGELRDWFSSALELIRPSLCADKSWQLKLDRLDAGAGRRVGVHLAVFAEPFLGHILSGAKTVESRFSTHRAAPFGAVTVGDIVLMKGVAAPVVGVFEVGSVLCLRLRGDELPTLRERFSAAMCADAAEFWSERSGARYASFLGVTEVRGVAQVPCPKRDRRGWVVLRAATSQLSLMEC